MTAPADPTVAQPTQPLVVTIPVPPPPPPAPSTVDVPAGSRVMTEAEIRQMQEDAMRIARETFQSDLRTRDDQLATLTADLTSRQEADAAREREAAEAVERERQAQLTLAERVAELDAARQADAQRFQDELARRDQVLALERQLSELSATRSRLIQEAGDSIMPHLHQYITGNTVEELQASIASAQATSASIAKDAMEAMAAQQQQGIQAWRKAEGVPITAPGGAGPVEVMGQQREYSLEQLQAMTPAEYAANRDQLLPIAGGNPQASGQMSGRGVGILG